MRNMGAVGTDRELVRMVKQYRKANPRIVNFWYKFDKVFITGGEVGRIRVVRDKRDRHVILPSKRVISYHDVRRYEINDKMTISFADPKGGRTATYGGRLTENVTQAVARDILGEAIVRLEDAGHRVVLHVHDEIGVEGSELDEVAKIAVEQPDWAKVLPLAVEGFMTDRYRKG